MLFEKVDFAVEPLKGSAIVSMVIAIEVFARVLRK